VRWVNCSKFSDPRPRNSCHQVECLSCKNRTSQRKKLVETWPRMRSIELCRSAYFTQVANCQHICHGLCYFYCCDDNNNNTSVLCFHRQLDTEAIMLSGIPCSHWWSSLLAGYTNCLREFRYIYYEIVWTVQKKNRKRPNHKLQPTNTVSHRPH